jgi:cullin-4
MYRADTAALARLYPFSCDAHVFTVFVKALHDHIDARVRVVISDPSNDPQMIDSTLKLKRFADSAVAGLFHVAPRTIRSSEAKEEEMEMDEDEDDDKDNDKDNRGHVITPEERTRRLELEEAVRSGFKSGFGSRQNAPAEWIGEWRQFVRC